LIDAEKINHTQPCSLQRWSEFPRPVFLTQQARPAPMKFIGMVRGIFYAERFS
jgi:hypothetical protein